MRISANDWNKYKNILARMSLTASKSFAKRFPSPELADINDVIDYAHALITKYGEGSAAAACQMYDEIARLSGASVPAAIPAETAPIKETARAVSGAMKQSPTLVSSVVARLVKQAGADTTLNNAIRDRAEWAWIPAGDTCAFCITLASRGWQKASPNQLKGGHAEHIHANCNCQFAIRFNKNDGVAGYNPDKYREMYDNAEGNSSKVKINALRKELAS